MLTIYILTVILFKSKLGKDEKMIARVLVWIIFIVGGAGLGVYIDRMFFISIRNNLIWHIISFTLGIFVLNFVIIISRNTGRTLAKFGRKGGNIPKMETNKIVKEGVYGCMRHPMHLGLLFFPLSIGLLLGSISFIILISPLEMIIMIIMIYLVEEPEAVKKFGEEYIKYKQQTPFFNFRIYCLKKLFKTG